MTNKGEGGVGTLLSIVALIAIGVFMWWLYQESTSIETVTPGDVEETPLTLAEIAANPAAAVGRHATLDSASVAIGLGQGAFTLRFDSATAYPVLLSPDAIQRLRMQNITVFGGDVVYVDGQIYTFNDSIAGAWVTQQAVEASMVANIPSMPSFLLADTVFVY